MTRLEEPGPDLYSNSIDAPKELCDHYTSADSVSRLGRCDLVRGPFNGYTLCRHWLWGSCLWALHLMKPCSRLGGRIGEAIACWYDPDSEDLASDAEVAFEQGFTGWKVRCDESGGVVGPIRKGLQNVSPLVWRAV